MSARPPRHPFQWVPTLYLAEGLPYALVLTVSLVFYQNLGLADQRTTFITSWLYLPWVLKPLWSPAVDILGRRRRWIWSMQLAMGVAVAAVALAVPTTHFLPVTAALFGLVALASATHDIAADGFYLLALPERKQSAFSGVRNTFFRLAGILARGPLVILVGWLCARTGSFTTAWTLAYAIAAGALLALAAYHGWMLPRPEADRPVIAPGHAREFLAEFARTAAAFFRKPGIGISILFLLVYRFGEAQLMPVSQLFFLNGRAAGGLGLSDAQVGFLYNIVGLVALMAGGLLGGWVISRNGLKAWLWPMLLAIHLPDAVFLWLAAAQPSDPALIAAGIACEQFGYGFGFAAYMVYMLRLAQGRHPTAHYALCTGFMALGMMIPGLWSGALKAVLGYKLFFAWVLLATIPSFWVAAKIPLDKDFGKRTDPAPMQE
jgi:PAT family beta-lactamase induction signal transducer AmpG